MCGIVGYIGEQSAPEILLNTLEALEYRGYDSAGIAVVGADAGIDLRKSQGKLKNLKALIQEQSLNGQVGIGHTRWATHGVPSDINAHPHLSDDKKIAIVHNGIISNYLELKNELIKDHNIQFHSDTDTEVIVNLVAVYFEQTGDILQAISRATDRLEGNYAFCTISQSEPEKLYLIANQAPLIIGLGEGELFCASDSAALLKYTNKIIRLEDKQIAELSNKGEYIIYQADHKTISETPRIQIVQEGVQALDKGGYKHFLMKEIHEQPDVLRKLYSYHVDKDGQIQFPDLDPKIFDGINRIMIVGCGTAYYAGIIGKYILEALAGIPVELEFASEIISRPNLIADENTLVLAISQSGETADTLLAVRRALKNNARLVAINNRPESSLVAWADGSSIFTQAGIEVSVAATKSFSAQIFCLYMVAIYLAEKADKIQPESLNWLKDQLRYQPIAIEQALLRKEEYKKAIIQYADKEAFIFLGRGISYAIALEGALKLKELTYVQATGYAAGEMKHGPIATLDQHVPTIGVLLPGQTYHKTLHNMLEAKTRGSANIGIVLDDDREALAELDTVLRLPVNYSELTNDLDIQELINPFTAVIPLQLVAYYLAEYLGKDIDQPRNLAKSVTVE